MKYLLLFLCLSLAACSRKPDTRLFVCINPQMSIQGVEIPANDPNVRITPRSIEFTTPNGLRITLPRALCMTVEGANS